MRQIEPHLFTTYCATRTACELIALLPKTDLVDELWTLMAVQYDILDTIKDGKHYGDNNLEDFLDYIDEVDEQIEKFKPEEEEEVFE